MRKSTESGWNVWGFLSVRRSGRRELKRMEYEDEVQDEDLADY